MEWKFRPVNIEYRRHSRPMINATSPKTPNAHLPKIEQRVIQAPGIRIIQQFRGGLDLSLIHI